jgi:hypothetical protein
VKFKLEIAQITEGYSEDDPVARMNSLKGLKLRQFT